MPNTIGEFEQQVIDESWALGMACRVRQEPEHAFNGPDMVVVTTRIPAKHPCVREYEFAVTRHAIEQIAFDNYGARIAQMCYRQLASFVEA